MSWDISWVDMCRVCMKVDGTLLPLYDETDESSENDLYVKLAELASIQVDRSDGLPTKLCTKCASSTNAFFKFKRLVQESDRKLRSMFNAVLISDPKDEPIDDKTADKYIFSQIQVDEDYNEHYKDEENSCHAYSNLNVADQEAVDSGSDVGSDLQGLHIVLHSDELNTVNNANQVQYVEEPNDDIEQLDGLFSKAEEVKTENEVGLEYETCIQMEEFERNRVTGVNSLDGGKQDDGDSDSDCLMDNQDNIVGSLNDTITKVKEIREDGRVKLYQCTLCLQNYQVLSEALSHIVELHVPSTGPFYCVVCEMDCDSIKQLRAHVLTHQGECPYRCFLCNKSYVMKRYLKRHMACHTDFPRHRCAKCGIRFKVKSELEAHISTHMGGPAYKCNQCPRVFNHKGNYKRHLISHLDPCGIHLPKFPCSVCNKRFLNNRTLVTHMRVHTGEKPFKCEICQKSFSQQGNLLIHQKIHTNPRSFTCEVCGKSFNQKATLRDHSLLHSGEKPYVCNICGLAFTFSAALRRHLWSHTGGKPHECDVCNAKFIGKYDLKRHMKIHSGRPKVKGKKLKVQEANVIEVPEGIINIVENESHPDTIFVEQILLCDDNSIQIIPQDSEKENVDSLLGLIEYTPVK